MIRWIQKCIESEETLCIKYKGMWIGFSRRKLGDVHGRWNGVSGAVLIALRHGFGPVLGHGIGDEI
jgi:hypothetical protein